MGKKGAQNNIWNQSGKYLKTKNNLKNERNYFKSTNN